MQTSRAARLTRHSQGLRQCLCHLGAVFGTRAKSPCQSALMACYLGPTGLVENSVPQMRHASQSERDTCGLDLSALWHVEVVSQPPRCADGA